MSSRLQRHLPQAKQGVGTSKATLLESSLTPTPPQEADHSPKRTRRLRLALFSAAMRIPARRRRPPAMRRVHRREEHSGSVFACNFSSFVSTAINFTDSPSRLQMCSVGGVVSVGLEESAAEALACSQVHAPVRCTSVVKWLVYLVVALERQVTVAAMCLRAKL